MDWERIPCSTLALNRCTICNGRGLVGKAMDQPCACVLRAVFRACYARFKREASGPFRRSSTFVCDFTLVGQRALADKPLELAIFKAHVLLGGDWKICCRQLKIDRGSFFHAVYRISEKLGRFFCELQPYALYPPREYFTLKLPRVRPCLVPAPVRRFTPVRPPLASKPVALPDPARSVPPVSEPVPVLIDAKAFARARFRDDGVSTRAIAADLSRRGIPAPNGAARWGQADVRRLLLAA